MLEVLRDHILRVAPEVAHDHVVERGQRLAEDERPAEDAVEERGLAQRVGGEGHVAVTERADDAAASFVPVARLHGRT